MPGFDLPPLVREKARRLGAAGERWLDALGPLVEELADAWSLTVGPTFAGGSAALVASVRTPDGDAVLKVLLPEPGAARQLETLVAADGRGTPGCSPTTCRGSSWCWRRSARRWPTPRCGPSRRCG